MEIDQILNILVSGAPRCKVEKQDIRCSFADPQFSTTMVDDQRKTF